MVFPTRKARFLTFLSFFNEKLLKKNLVTIPSSRLEEASTLHDDSVARSLVENFNSFGETKKRGQSTPSLNNSNAGCVRGGKIFYSTKIEAKIFYHNADTQKLQILNENNYKSGVYRWINKETGKSYVGSAINLSKRFYIYYSRLSIKRILI